MTKTKAIMSRWLHKCRQAINKYIISTYHYILLTSVDIIPFNDTALFVYGFICCFLYCLCDIVYFLCDITSATTIPIAISHTIQDTSAIHTILVYKGHTIAYLFVCSFV
jgi:hypothetical protein